MGVHEKFSYKTFEDLLRKIEEFKLNIPYDTNIDILKEGKEKEGEKKPEKETQKKEKAKEKEKKETTKKETLKKIKKSEKKAK